MRIAFALNGSRGDIQPGVILASALAGRGHDVVTGVPENLLSVAASFGVEATEFAPDTDELLSSPLITRDLKSRNPRTRSRALRQVTEFGAEVMDDRLLTLADGADVVVTGLMGQERGATVAHHRGAAFVPLHYCPIRPNHTVRVPLGPLGAIPPSFVTGALWRAVDLAYWFASAKGADDALRRRLGMSSAVRPVGDRLRSDGTPEIQAYDPMLFPGLSDEWGAQRPFSGFLTPEGAGSSTASDGDVALSDWLDAGDPPVYVGFGSMPLPDPVRTYRALHAAAGVAGYRVLLVTGPHHDAAAELTAELRGAGGDGPGAAWVARAVDHRSVLPRCSAAIHHGGAGTTGACLYAGVPQLVAAFSADQPMWGRAVTDAGIGRTCGFARVCDRDFVATAIEAITTADPARAARDIAAKIISPRDAVVAASVAIENSR